MRTGILAAGNWIIDHVKIIDTWPPQDGLANILEQSAANGGGPYNVLKDLAKLGAPFPLAGIGLLGDDDNARRILADCQAHGIDAAQLQTIPATTTSYTDVMTVRGSGRRTFFHNRGANALLAPRHFDFSRTQAKYLYLGYLLLLDALDAPSTVIPGKSQAVEVLRAARAAGLKTSLDCVSENSNRFGEIVAPALAEVDLLFTNDFEAEKLTGLTLGRGDALDRDAVEQAGQALLQRGVRETVLIHFPEGAYACSADGSRVWQPSVKVPDEFVAGSAGAGDAFAAGVLYGVHEGWSFQAGLELGVCAAAASLAHPTCSEAVLPVADCLALGRRFGFR